jgi:hypothetical protein
MDLVEKQSGNPLRVLMVSQRMVPYVAGAELQALLQAGVQTRIVTTRYSPKLARRETIDGVRARHLAVLRESKTASS